LMCRLRTGSVIEDRWKGCSLLRGVRAMMF